MNKLIDYAKKNKTIIIVVIILFALILALYYINTKSSSSQTAGDFTQKTQTEIKLASILSNIKGVGQSDVMINEGEDGEICGVVIVCTGADNIMVRNDILNAVSTALKVEKNLIAIYSMTV
ncbi:MAG: hypothetical protein E7370_01480 [Clostridiales bacterium]|nr:hypothetical protein [Clostridiales bacterium]